MGRNVFKKKRYNRIKNNNIELTREEQNNKMRRKDNIYGIAVVSVMVIGIITLLLYSGGMLDGIANVGTDNYAQGNETDGDTKVNMNTKEVVTGVKEYTQEEVKQQKPSIQVPGYLQLNWKAEETMQDVYFTNPEANTCYFVMSMVLEDGRKIWESDYLEPGNAFCRIKLSEPLKAGKYKNVLLKYQTYSLLDRKTKFNGSQMKLTINVSE